MSNIQYGLISRVDSDTMEKTFDLIHEQFPDEIINYLEIGLYHGRSTSGVKTYFDSKGYKYNLTGIDNFKDKEELVFLPTGVNLIEGSSIEVYNQLEDNSQHFILIDGNHAFPYDVADFFCYKDKVKKNGYICFHDASPQTQGKSYQRMGSESDPDMHIAVMRALKEIGLLDNKINGWVNIFHEWDVYDEGGGVMIFKKTI